MMENRALLRSLGLILILLFPAAAPAADSDEPDKAIIQFSAAIGQDPNSAEAYRSRGEAFARQGDYDSAIHDYTEAIKLDRSFALAFIGRGFAWESKGDDDKALLNYADAIRANPRAATGYCHRGAVLVRKGSYEKAVTDYSEAIQFAPQDALAYQKLAWLQATCPRGRYRDGKKAIDNATKAGELFAWKSYADFETLAAAYAETGDFPSAVKWQKKAIEMQEPKPRGYSRSRLQLYKAKEPYREVLD
jgi:tetratricopeptide (TPR) repeat protein